MRGRKLVCLLLAIAAISAAPITCGAAGDHSELICRTNLLLIYDAIQHYRAEYRDVPQWLSDLQPRFIADRETLYCPLAKASGQTSIRVTGRTKLNDPNTSYFYEFNPGELKSPRGHSNREWKFAQMRVVGAVVPIVRCLLHRDALNLKRVDGVLNLAFSGVIYKSGLFWESNFTDNLTAEYLLTQDASVRLVVVPPRAETATPREIDLSGFYNVSLQRPSRDERDIVDLSAVPAALVEWQGVQFDLRGAVQFASRKNGEVFPTESPSIAVAQKCQRLHFIHGCIGSVAVGTTIGKYTIHYANGLGREVPLIFGRNIAPLHGPFTPADLVDAKVAFAQTNSLRPVRLCHFIWTNPEPTKSVSALRVTSALANAAPIVIAISVEP